MKYKLIFNAGVARHLLRQGNPIVDIKPDKDSDNPYKTIFIFEETEKLNKDMASVGGH